MKKLLLFWLLLLGYGASAQQNPQYSQYIFNGLVINPAYAGSKGILNINGIYRTQWVGLEGAPTTQTLSLDAAVAKEKIGLGLHVMNDQIGAQGQKSFYLSTAFRVRLGESARLALGLAGGASEYYIDGTQLHPTEPGYDSAIPTSYERSMLPDAKAGIFFNTERFYLGLSASNLVGFKNDFVATPTRHYFITTGYVFDLSDMIKFKPSVLLKDDLKSTANLDLNSFFLIGDRIWLGGGYRMGVKYLSKPNPENQDLSMRNAWMGMTEIYFTPKIKIGYSHDITLTSLRSYATHEVSIGFYFFKKEEARTLTVRYF
ncbi:PorP/SprF family type IX secretion system membrane protein [Adhaeribacter aerolatus]|nr:type IX secretion system membrane protein PorP/SprF [Adhaeribacter aerolatus]